MIDRKLLERVNAHLWRVETTEQLKAENFLESTAIREELEKALTKEKE